MSAVILLQEMMLSKKLDPESYPYDDLEDNGKYSTSDNNKDRTAVLAIAYHNMGVEQEFLKSYPAAILSYKKAVNFAEKHLGPEDGITQNLRQVFENAKVEVRKNSINLAFSSISHCIRRVKSQSRVNHWRVNLTATSTSLVAITLKCGNSVMNF